MAKHATQALQENNRFAQLAHYVLWYCKEQQKQKRQEKKHVLKDIAQYQLGAVKFNKILWAIDVDAVLRKGRSLSGEKAYIKRHWGPVPRHILATLEDLESEGVIAQIQQPSSTKTTDDDMRINPEQCEVLKAPEEGYFTQEERQRIEAYCRYLLSYTGQALSNFSHDAVYDSYDMGEHIPLNIYLAGEIGEPGKDPQVKAIGRKLFDEMKASSN